DGRCGRGRQGRGRRPQPRDIEDATGHPGVHPRIAQSPRGGTGTQMTTRRGRRWSLDVTTKSNALDLEANVFTRDDPKTVARSLKQSAERSHRRKSDPYRSAMSMLTFYINRAGKDTALTIRNTLLGGRRSGVATASGVSSGQAIWTLATSAGLAVILVASGPLFLAVRLAGAAYLIYLGVRSLIKAAARSASDDAAAHGAAGRLPPRAAYWQGLLSNLSNAKMVAFFISLLPQFAG